MQLREFVTKTLVDLIGGVQDAQSQTPPDTVVPSELRKLIELVKIGCSEMQIVEFEVTVKVDEKSGRDSGLSVVAAVLNAGIKGTTAKDQGHAATLKFRIPVKFPTSGAKPK